MPTKAPSETTRATDAKRLASKYWPKVVGLGTSFQATSPAVAAVRPRMGVYTNQLERDTRRSHTFEIAPTTSAPSGPNATAENTSGKNVTDCHVRSLIATCCCSAKAATAPSARSAHTCGNR